MPKGIAMKLQRGGAILPGIEKRGLPSDLQGRLPKRPWNQELAVVDRQGVLIEKTTGLVLDVVEVLGERQPNPGSGRFTLAPRTGHRGRRNGARPG